jgi:hypothetical protein
MSFLEDAALARLALITPVALKSVRSGVLVHCGEPFFRVRDDRFKHDGIALSANPHLVALEAKFLRQADSLAVTIPEKLGSLAHRLASTRQYI